MGTDKRYTAEDHARYREGVEAEQKKEAETRERNAALMSWKAAGGKEEDFVWEALRTEDAARKMEAREREAREAHAGLRVSRI